MRRVALIYNPASGQHLNQRSGRIADVLAVLREAGISLWVALASDGDRFCRTKQCRERQADGRPMPTYSNIAFVSISWESLGPRNTPREQSRACRHDIAHCRTRIATDASKGCTWPGPECKDRPLFQWRRMRHAARMLDALDQWHADMAEGLEAGQSDADRLQGYVDIAFP